MNLPRHCNRTNSVVFVLAPMSSARSCREGNLVLIKTIEHRETLKSYPTSVSNERETKLKDELV